MLVFVFLILLAGSRVVTSKRNPLLSVNYHFTRKCNYRCGFCFHTSLTSYMESIDKSKEMLRQLRLHGCEKINFAGGEPFLYPEHLGEMVKYAKETCHFPSVSIITNGVFVEEKWFEKYAEHLDMLGLSCDSSDEAINKLIGRGTGDHVQYIKRAAGLCHAYKVMLKLNTVVNKYNWESDMSELIREVKPIRWKLFQVKKHTTKLQSRTYPSVNTHAYINSHIHPAIT